MGNCFVTKLKETVNNDNLVKVGEFMVTFKTLSTYNISTDGLMYFNVLPGESVDFRINGNGYYLDNPADDADVSKHKTQGRLTYNPDTNTGLYFSNGDYTVLFENKYALTVIYPNGNTTNGGNISFNIDGLAYSPLKVITWTREGITGNLSSIKSMTDLTRFIINNSHITGSLWDLPTAPITRIEVINSLVGGELSALAKFAATLTNLMARDNPNVTGTMADLGVLTALTILSLTNKNGTFESFVSGQINATVNPRATCTTGVQVSGFLPTVSLGGKTYPSEQGIQFITWDSETKIAILAGGGSLGDTTRVYCKGYTQEEAEAKWPGKTITRVEA